MGVSALLLFRPRIAPLALAVVSFAFTMSFNPVVHGGARYLTDNPLSQRMRALDREENGNTVWVVFGEPALGNLPKILGLKSLSGQYFYPQLGLWKTLDPQAKYLGNYNRYANSNWRMRPGPGVEVEAPQADMLVVKIDPANEGLRKLGVNYFLVGGDPSFFLERKKTFEPIFSFADKHIFRFRSTTL